MAGRRSFAARLLAWYDAQARDLPWRACGDPWAIWVSEVMLQQTRVEAVREAFSRFLQSYPTPASFAEAGDDELHAAWRGLGYYRRARLLREGAQAVVEGHGGRVPADPEELGRLPGIGPYTRGAIASIAFGLREPAVDGNVERVLARHLALRADVQTAPARQTIAAAVMRRQDRARPGDFNQALMELGATVCLPAAPRCELCPVAVDCRGRAAGIAGELPQRPPRRAPAFVRARAAWIPHRGVVLARRIPPGAINGGQIELPGPGLLHPLAGPADLARALRGLCGARVTVGTELCTVRHAITDHRIALTVHAARAHARGELFGADPRDDRAPWTTASRKAFAAIARARTAAVEP